LKDTSIDGVSQLEVVAPEYATTIFVPSSNDAVIDIVAADPAEPLNVENDPILFAIDNAVNAVLEADTTTWSDACTP
jgi:hypothetical protein